MSRLSPAKRHLSALILISAIFASAAVLRAGGLVMSFAMAEPTDAAGQAMAQQQGEEQSAMPEPMTEAAATAPEDPDDMAAVSGGDRPELLLRAIRARSISLDERERKILERERALEVIAKRVAAELPKLEQERLALAELIANAQRHSVEGTEQLVKIYQTMKPKQAAAIFDEMDPRIAVVFLRDMRGEAASFIIANMNVKKAYAITLLMAGRNLTRGES